MTAPRRAAEALERAVNAQVAQRQAAQETRKPVEITGETEVETPETDRDQ